MTMHAFICGCAGARLQENEVAFIREARPFGLILFRRNVETPDQVLRLTDQFRDITGRADAAILVDQEGGRVQRLGPPHWRPYPSARVLAGLGDEAIELVVRLMAHDLLAAGINIDCLPVLDVPAPGAHDVIGARAYGEDPQQVASMGARAARALLAGGVLPVMKHIPGHGRANADSHFALPIIDTSLKELEATDFLPFRACRDLPMAMTAHVIYRAIDPEQPATLSAAVVRQIIRGSIGFDGLLLSDDLSMKALSGTFAEKTSRLFAAGVDIALHCSGNLEEAAQVAAHSPPLSGKALLRAQAAMAMRDSPADFDPVDAARRLDAMTAKVA